MDDNRTKFIRKLAEFLAEQSAAKSILYAVESIRPLDDLRPRLAVEWANLRGYAPLFGYQTVDEVERVLTDFLGGK